MVEYLERESILNAIRKTSNLYVDQQGLYLSCELIAAMPASDVQPVKHGRWECVGHDDKTYWYRCSVCGHEEHDNMTKHDNYCGSCGARMDGDING